MFVVATGIVSFAAMIRYLRRRMSVAVMFSPVVVIISFTASCTHVVLVAVTMATTRATVTLVRCRRTARGCCSACVRSQVFGEVAGIGEALGADTARIPLVTCMNAHVLHEVVRPGERSVAVRTPEWLDARVDLQMPVQLGRLGEMLQAHRAGMHQMAPTEMLRELEGR